MKTEYNFTERELESSLKDCEKKGITELVVHDDALSCNKNKLLHFLKIVERDALNLFLSIKIDCSIIDAELCKEFENVNCSIEIPFVPSKKDSGNNNSLVFDKKSYAKKCTLLNNFGLVFGVELFYANDIGDTLKLFKDRVDFACSQYPNHIDFPQTESSIDENNAHISGVFSGNDIRYARDIAFACRSFYSAGRAVTWFNSVLRPLKIQAASFFADFAEWQRVNNCDYKSGFVPENVKHEDIEKMQLLFLSMKYDEKKETSIFSVVKNIVIINGALSRLVSDGTECIVETQYNPDDLFGPESFDLESFANDVCMENCSVKLYINNGDVDYKIL